jgi:hypothetical protein
MNIENIAFEEINNVFLQNLLDNQVQEGKTIEYKEYLTISSDSEKKEFLADISSFSNSSGGLIIFGIKEDKGIPIELLGLEIIDIDMEIQRIENIIRDGIEPRIWGISIKTIIINESRRVIVIKIPKSWALPHMVSFSGQSKFYSRNSIGKYPLDVSEIRNLFSQSSTLSDQINNFRLERLSTIVSDDTPIPLEEGAKLVVHLIPFVSFSPNVNVNLIDFGLKPPNPIYSSGYNGRFNFDGFLSFCNTSDNRKACSYIEFFRNGKIEAVNTSLLRQRDGKKYIPSEAFERELIDCVNSYLQLQKQKNIEPPIALFVSLLNVSGYEMAVDPRRSFYEEPRPIEKKDLLVDGVLIEDFDCEASQLLKPIIDSIWNATGWPQSMNYNENGDWIFQSKI